MEVHKLEMYDSGANINVVGTSFPIATRDISNSDLNTSYQDIKYMID